MSRPLPKPNQRGGIRAHTREMIGQAARRFAEGASMSQIAKEFHVTLRAVEGWRTRHKRIWMRDFRLSLQDVVSRVRKDAGTDRVIANPDEYLRFAKEADRWCKENRQELFPQSDIDLSLSGFFRIYFLPVRLGDAHPTTIEQYRFTLNLWRRITGDPPLRLIDNQLLAKFRDVLSKLRGQGGRPYSTSTIRSKMIQIQAILDTAGPPGPRRRTAAGLLSVVPYAKPPRIEQQVPRIVPLEVLGRVYEAARYARIPELYGITPENWWKGMLVVALNTALRRGSLFALRWEHVEAENRRLVLPPGVMKARRGQIIPLNEMALRHLETIRQSQDPMVFPWPYCQHTFANEFKALQRVAGVPAGEWFGLHAIRRTAATLLWRENPAAAQLILGHHAMQITREHYVNAPAVMMGALDHLPQPAAFG